MKQKSRTIKLQPKAKNFRIAIVCSRFNEKICEGLLAGAMQALYELGVPDKKITVLKVPGAFEIPLVAQKLARSKKYQGIACLGAVIRGDTPHFDYVCQSVTMGLTRVVLDFSVPIAFGVLTTNTLDQALARSAPDEYNKGREAILTVLEMVELVGKG